MNEIPKVLSDNKLSEQVLTITGYFFEQAQKLYKI